MPLIGAPVEIIEPIYGGNPDTMPALKPTMIRVNGVDVGMILRGSVEVRAGENGGSNDHPTQVTFTLLPRKLEIKAEVVNEELGTATAGDPQGPAEV
jgi:hypothetical protein